MSKQLTLGTKTGADFSLCRKYRYKLWRIWDNNKPIMMFLMLNPSTADETQNDPTVERCERRARMSSFGGVVICNIFAFRATDPKDMKAASDPIGPDNNTIIIAESKAAEIVVCAWGNHGSFNNRSAEIKKMLFAEHIVVHAIKISKSGEPAHPLYQPYARVPLFWTYEPA